MDSVIIDFSLLNSPSSSTQASQELDKFRSALTSWGCFQLINHGIPREFLDDMREVSKQIFTLPMEEKCKHEMLPGDTNGFRGIAVMNSSPKVAVDWNEALTLTVYPQDRHQLKFWPHKPPELKKMLYEYTMKLTNIFDILFKMVVRSLNVDVGKVEERYGKNKEITASFNFYPRCPNPERVLGLKPHADFSAFTIGLQDELGLQIQKDGQWFMVPVIPDALFVNIGDPIEIMSNGIFKSAVHRVVTSTEKARVSLVMFWDSDRNNEIGPLDELITDNQPQLYKMISHEDYINNFYGYYESGQRSIDSVRI